MQFVTDKRVCPAIQSDTCDGEPTPGILHLDVKYRTKLNKGMNTAFQE